MKLPIPEGHYDNFVSMTLQEKDAAYDFPDSWNIISGKRQVTSDKEPFL